MFETCLFVLGVASFTPMGGKKKNLSTILKERH